MVCGVVFAHLELTIGDMAVKNPDFLLDEVSAPETDVQGNALVEDMLTDLEGGLTVRWISVVRPWCLPMLFWVSGASAALSSKSDVSSSVSLLIKFTILGMVLNGALWFLGPANPKCSPFKPCTGQGTLWDFSICAGSGHIFPIVFQMWYTIFLAVMTVWKKPLFQAIREDNNDSACRVFTQWGATCVVYALLVFVSQLDRPVLVWMCLCTSEAALLGLALCTLQRYRAKLEAWLSCHGVPWRKLFDEESKGVPLRLVHYGIGLMLVLQFGATPFANKMSHISPAFCSFIMVGFKQFYVLGFLMVRARRDEEADRENKRVHAEPIVSRVWPMAFFFLVLLAPSTNWLRAGNLTYPFLPEAMDRCRYIAGGVVVIFITDRASRAIQCDPMPGPLNIASLFLYLTHPVMMTFLIVVAGTPPPVISSWIICIVMAALVSLPLAKLMAGTPTKVDALRTTLRQDV